MTDIGKSELERARDEVAHAIERAIPDLQNGGEVADAVKWLATYIARSEFASASAGGGEPRTLADRVKEQDRAAEFRLASDPRNDPPAHAAPEADGEEWRSRCSCGASNAEDHSEWCQYHIDRRIAEALRAAQARIAELEREMMFARKAEAAIRDAAALREAMEKAIANLSIHIPDAAPINASVDVILTDVTAVCDDLTAALSAPAISEGREPVGGSDFDAEVAATRPKQQWEPVGPDLGKVREAVRRIIKLKYENPEDEFDRGWNSASSSAIAIIIDALALTPTEKNDG